MTTERSLLLTSQNRLYQTNYSMNVSTILNYTNNNTDTIKDLLYGQLLEVKKNRYQPYQPYIPMVVPQSVIDLQMRTANVGVPESFFTISNCKGSQSVTTSNVINM